MGDEPDLTKDYPATTASMKLSNLTLNTDGTVKFNFIFNLAPNVDAFTWLDAQSFSDDSSNFDGNISGGHSYHIYADPRHDPGQGEDPHYYNAFIYYFPSIGFYTSPQFNFGTITLGNITTPSQATDLQLNGNLAIPGVIFLEWQSLAGDPVNVTDGALNINIFDYTSSGPVPITIQRSYSSASDSHSILGRGWRLNYTSNIEMGNYTASGNPRQRVKVVESDGTLISYTGAVVNGTVSELTFDTDDNTALLALGGPAVYSAQNSNITVASGQYVLTRQNGSQDVYVANATWGNTSTTLFLIKKIDAQGNVITIDHYNSNGTTSGNVNIPQLGLISTISSVDGDSVKFLYDTNGYLQYIQGTPQNPVSNPSTRPNIIAYTVDFFGDLAQVEYQNSLNTSGLTLYSYATTYDPGTLSFNGVAYTTDNHVPNANSTNLNPDYNSTPNITISNITRSSLISQIQEKANDGGSANIHDYVLQIAYDTSNRVVDQWEVNDNNRAGVSAGAHKTAHFDYDTDTVNGNAIGITNFTNALGQVTRYKYLGSLIYRTDHLNANGSINTSDLQSWYLMHGGNTSIFDAGNETFVSASSGNFSDHSLAQEINEMGLVTQFAYQSNTPYTSQITQTGAYLNGTSSSTGTRTANMTWNTTTGLVTEIDEPTTKTVFAYGNTTATAYLPVSITKYNYVSSGQVLSKEIFDYTSVSDGNTTIYGLLRGKYTGDGTNDGHLTTYIYYSGNGTQVGQTLGRVSSATSWHDLKSATPSSWPTTSGNASVDVVSNYTYNFYSHPNSSIEINYPLSIYKQTSGGLLTQDFFDLGHKNLGHEDYDNSTAGHTLVHKDLWQYKRDVLIDHQSFPGTSSQVIKEESFTYDFQKHVITVSQIRTLANSSHNGVTNSSSEDTNSQYDLNGNVLNTSDPLGGNRTFTYDVLNHPVAELFASNNTTLANITYASLPNGQISNITNQLAQSNSAGNGTSATDHRDYSLLGDIYHENKTTGEEVAFDYDLDRHILTETLPNGSSWDYDYHSFAVNGTTGLRQVTRTFTPATGLPGVGNIAEDRFYDAWGQLCKYITPAGATYEYTYDGLGRQTSVTVNGVETTTTAYDLGNRTTTVTDPLSNQSITTVNVLGQTTSRIVKNSGGTVIDQANISYNLTAQSMTETHGNVSDASTFPSQTKTFFDTYNRPVIIQTYTSSNTSITTVNKYDALGRLTETDTDDPNQSGSDLARVTTHTYDGLGRLLTTTYPGSRKLVLAYDGTSSVTRREMWGTIPSGGGSDAERLVWLGDYDRAGRLLDESLTQGNTSTRHFTYDYFSASTSAAPAKLHTVQDDARGIVTTTSSSNYDALGRSLGFATSDIGNATTIPHFSQNITYDISGAVANVTQTYANSTLYPTTLIANSYDNRGRPQTQQVTIGNTTHSTWNQSFDADGRRDHLYRSTSGDSYDYSYDAAGHLAAVTEDFSGQSSQVYNFSYSTSGLLAQRDNPFRTQTINDRDWRGLPGNITTAYKANSTTFTALYESNITWRSDATLGAYNVTRSGQTPSAWSDTFSYDDTSHLTNETHTPAGNYTAWSGNYAFPAQGWDTLANATYTGLALPYTAALQSNFTTGNFGRAMSDTRIIASNDTKSVQITGNAQNAQSILASLGPDSGNLSPISSGNIAFNTTTFTFSANLALTPGNYTLQVKGKAGQAYIGDTKTRNFTVTNQHPSTWNITYDGGGYPTQRANSATGVTETVIWDAQGRLLKSSTRDASGNGADQTYVYDGLGRLLTATQTQFTSGNATGTPFVTASEYDPAVEFLEIATRVTASSGNGTVTAWKVYGPDISGGYGSAQGIGGLESVITLSGNQCYRVGTLSNMFGSPQGRMALDGTPGFAWLSTTGTLSSYGAALTSTPLPALASASGTASGLPAALIESAAWRGRKVDTSGRIYLGARWYDPSAGRFISPDPAGHSASWDLYSYAGGDPVNGFDPDGRCGESSMFADSIVTSSYGWGEGLSSSPTNIISSNPTRMQQLETAWNNRISIRQETWGEQLDDLRGSKSDVISGAEYAQANAESKKAQYALLLRIYQLEQEKQLADQRARQLEQQDTAYYLNHNGAKLDLINQASQVPIVQIPALAYLAIDAHNNGAFGVSRDAGTSAVVILALTMAPGGGGGGRSAGLRLNIFGEGEAPGFLDVSTNVRFANGRQLTASLGNGSASNIFIRNAPITGENTISEILRLSQPGTQITLMQPADGFQGQALINAFGNRASVDFIRTFPSKTVAPNVNMTILRMTVGGH